MIRESEHDPDAEAMVDFVLPLDAVIAAATSNKFSVVSSAPTIEGPIGEFPVVLLLLNPIAAVQLQRACTRAVAADPEAGWNVALREFVLTLDKIAIEHASMLIGKVDR